MARTARFTGQPVSVDVTPEIRTAIERIAERDQVGLNAVIRYLVEEPVTADQLLASTNRTVPRTA